MTQKSYCVLCTDWITGIFSAAHYFAENTQDLHKQLDKESEELTAEMVKRDPNYVIVDTEWYYIIPENESKTEQDFLLQGIQHHTTKHHVSEVCN